MTCQEWIRTKRMLRMGVAISRHVRMKLLQDPVDEDLRRFHQIFKLLVDAEFF